MARTPEQRLTQRIGEIVDSHDRLNRADWVLSRKLPMIRRILSKYKKSLRLTFFGYLDSSALDKELNDSIDLFFERMERFVKDGRLKKKNIDRAVILRQTKNELLKQYTGVSDAMVDRQLQKSRRFKIRSELAEVKEAQLAQISEKINTVRIEGVTFEKDPLDDVWSQIQGRYGENGQVIFTSGNNRPLRTYVDQRTETTANDVQRSGTVLTAASTGTFFGRISRHGAIDSCILHEGELVFMSQALKNQFMRDKPDLVPLVRDIQTVQEIEQDSTHTFSFGCKHTVLVEGVQFFGAKALRRNLEENVVNRVGRLKLSEAAIENNVRAGNIEQGFDLTKQNVDLVVAKKFREKGVRAAAPAKSIVEIFDEMRFTNSPEQLNTIDELKEDNQREKIEEAIKKTFEHNDSVPDDVKDSVATYTGEGDDQFINEQLREGRLTEQTSEKLEEAIGLGRLDEDFDPENTIADIDEYIENAPKFSGDVFRGLRFETQKQLRTFIEKLDEEKGFSMKSYMSSSGFEERADRFARGQFSLRMKIKSKNAVSIVSLSKVPKEMEFLFPRDSVFTLKRLTVEGFEQGKIATVELEEV